ncbi:HAUS augmin-like complex subunit 7 [Elysia marginata]|uniref:HAUS augmin-like complex subunit 7 n=1 Tax=Elysia marginata TaxID=1093978 RepID=A0AAV4IEA8_9GAST|nr:HAUS augmin-like complex subunit 7 [Elysia marginata]
MDEKAVEDLVLTQGKGRFYILQWLFTRYDSRLACLLNPTHDHTVVKNESILQRLLIAASSMCLCKPDDIELIKGEAPQSRQINFINKLLKLVCASEKRFSQESSDSPMASQLNNYMDAVVSQEGFLYMLEDQVDLLPRDIKAEVERDWTRTGWDKDARVPPVPKLEDLVMKSQDLSVELEKHNLTLTRLKEEVTVQEGTSSTEVQGLNQVLCRAARDLSQMCQAFSQCYQASVEQWCHRPPPQLSQLGPAFHRVHAQLTKFTKMLEDLKAMRHNTTQLDRRVLERPEDSSHSLAEESKQATDRLESCLTVLEEALHRSATEFSSRSPLLAV